MQNENRDIAFLKQYWSIVEKLNSSGELDTWVQAQLIKKVWGVANRNNIYLFMQRNNRGNKSSELEVAFLEQFFNSEYKTKKRGVI